MKSRIRKSIAAVLLTLAIMPTFPAQASYEEKVPHTTGSRVDAAGRFGPSRYTIAIHVTGYELSEFLITSPKGLRLGPLVKVFGPDGNVIDTRVEMIGETVKLAFAQPIALRSNLTIQLDGVKTSDNTVIRDLEMSAKMRGMNAFIPLMTVRMMPGIHS